MTSVRKRLDEIELLEALEPIAAENAAAKQAYEAALESGDPAEIERARHRKAEAARRLNETRCWLRTEATVKALTARLEAIEGRGKPKDAQQVRAQLERWEKRAQRFRDALAELAEQKKGGR